MSAPDDFDHRLTPERRPASRLDAEVERLRRSPTPTQGRPDPGTTFTAANAFDFIDLPSTAAPSNFVRLVRED